MCLSSCQAKSYQRCGIYATANSVKGRSIEAKRPKLLADLGWHEAEWHVHYAFFSREGFSEAATGYATRHQIDLVDLPRLENGGFLGIRVDCAP